MSTAGDYRLAGLGAGRLLEQVASTGGCAHPVRLVGSATTVDPATGEVLTSYDSRCEPDGVTYVRCGNRRASVCPSCSAEYKGDMWHLLVAGAAGGLKGVPEAVRSHPLVFATLTAPSFGPVHSHKRPGRSGTRRCRPRSGSPLCPHGIPAWCMAIHDEGDERVGQPLCPDCYDYVGHVLWQWWAPELWRRFTIAARRALAHYLGLSETVARGQVRMQFAKVAEFQRRGIVHFHALVRLDGPPRDGDDYPPPRVDVPATTLGELVSSAAAQVSYATPADGSHLPALELGFGPQVDVRVVHDTAPAADEGAGDLRPETVAAYIAKYATKATDDLDPGGAGQNTNPHVRRIRATVDRLGDHATKGSRKEVPYGLLGRWRHMLGFRGHFATKSRGYSTTLGAIRAERRHHRQHQDLDAPRRAGDLDEQSDTAGVESTLVVGSWLFAGMGWLTDCDAALAAATAARARAHREQRAAARRQPTGS